MAYPVVFISLRDIFFPSFSLIHAKKHKMWEKENSYKIHNHGNKRSQKQKTFRPVSNSGCTGVLIHIGEVGYIHLYNYTRYMLEMFLWVPWFTITTVIQILNHANITSTDNIQYVWHQLCNYTTLYNTQHWQASWGLQINIQHRHINWLGHINLNFRFSS